jgi:fucose 4-O-acetylase-like acetyltransferase
LSIGLALTVLLLVILPELTERTDIYSLSAYWSPLNFLAYPFVAVLFVRNREVAQARQKTIFWTGIACCIVFAAFEWNYAVKDIYFINQGFALPPYTRPSLVFGVAAVAVLALRPAIQSYPVIRFMAVNTLALYCLHIFFSPIIRQHLESFTQNAFLLTYGSIILTICWSYLLAALLRNYLKQEVLM